MQKQEYTATAETMMQDPLTREQLKTGEFLKRLLEFASTQPLSYLDPKNIDARLQHMAEKDGHLSSLLKKEKTELSPQDKNYLDFARVRAMLYLELKSRAESLRLLPKQEVITSMVVDDVLRNIKLGLDQRVAQGKKKKQEADEEYKKIAEEMMSTHGQSVGKLMDQQDRKRAAAEANTIDQALSMLNMGRVDRNELSREVDRVLQVFLLLSQSGDKTTIDYGTILNTEGHPAWESFVAVASSIDRSFESKWRLRRDTCLHEATSQSLGDARTFFLLRPFISDERKARTGSNALEQAAASINVEEFFQKHPNLRQQSDFPANSTAIDKIKWWVDFLDKKGRPVSKQLKQVREIIDQVEKGRRDQVQADKKMQVINVLRLISMIGPQLAQVAESDDVVDLFEQFTDRVDDVAIDHIAKTIHPLLDGYFDTYSHFPEDRHQEINQKLSTLIYESSKSYISGDNDQLVEVLYKSLSDTELWDAIGYTALPFLAHVYEQEDIVADIAESLDVLTEWGQSPLDLEKLKEVGPAQQNLINALLRLVFAIRDYDPNNIVFDIDAPEEVRVYNDKGEVEVFPIDPEIVAQMNEELINPDYLPPVEFYEKAFAHYEQMWKEVYGGDGAVPEIHRTIDNSAEKQLRDLIGDFFGDRSVDAIYELRGENASDWFADAMISLPGSFEQIKEMIQEKDSEYAQKFEDTPLLSYYQAYIDFVVSQSTGGSLVEESNILAFALLRCNGNLSDAQREVAIFYKLLGRYDLDTGYYYGNTGVNDIFFKSPDFNKNLEIFRLIKFETTVTRVPISVFERLPTELRILTQRSHPTAGASSLSSVQSPGDKEIELADALGGPYHMVSSRAMATYSQVPVALIGLGHSLLEAPFIPVISHRFPFFNFYPAEQSGTKAAALTMMARDNIDFAREVLPTIPIAEERASTPELPSDCFQVGSITRLSEYKAQADIDFQLNESIPIGDGMSLVLLERGEGYAEMYVGPSQSIESMLHAQRYGFNLSGYYAEDRSMPTELRLKVLELLVEQRIDLRPNLSFIGAYWKYDLSREENIKAVLKAFAILQEQLNDEQTHAYYDNLEFLVENNIDAPGLEEMLAEVLSVEVNPGAEQRDSLDISRLLLSLYESGRITDFDYPVVHSMVQRIAEGRSGSEYALVFLIARSHNDHLLDMLAEQNVSIESLADIGTWLKEVRWTQSDGSRHANEFLDPILHEAFANADEESMVELLKSVIYQLSVENFSYLIDQQLINPDHIKTVVGDLDTSSSMPHAWAIYEYIQNHAELQLNETELFPLLTESLVNRDMPLTYFPQWLKVLSESDAKQNLLDHSNVLSAVNDYVNNQENYVENRVVLIKYCIEHDEIAIEGIVDLDSYFSKNDLAELIISNQLGDNLKSLLISKLLFEVQLSDLSEQSIAGLTRVEFMNELAKFGHSLFEYVEIFGPFLGRESLEQVFNQVIDSRYEESYKFAVYQSLIDAGLIDGLDDIPNIDLLADAVGSDFIIYKKYGYSDYLKSEEIYDLMYGFLQTRLDFPRFIDALEAVHLQSLENGEISLANSTLDSTLFDRSNLEQMPDFSEDRFSRMLAILDDETKIVANAVNNGQYDQSYWNMVNIVENLNLIYHNYGDKLNNPALHKDVTTRFIRLAGNIYQMDLDSVGGEFAQNRLNETLEIIDKSLFSANDRDMIMDLFPDLAKEMFNRYPKN